MSDDVAFAFSPYKQSLDKPCNVILKSWWSGFRCINQKHEKFEVNFARPEEKGQTSDHLSKPTSDHWKEKCIGICDVIVWTKHEENMMISQTCCAKILVL